MVVKYKMLVQGCIVVSVNCLFFSFKYTINCLFVTKMKLHGYYNSSETVFWSLPNNSLIILEATFMALISGRLKKNKINIIPNHYDGNRIAISLYVRGLQHSLVQHQRTLTHA